MSDKANAKRLMDAATKAYGHKPTMAELVSFMVSEEGKSEAKNKYNPSQPRDQDGQWTDGGGSGSTSSFKDYDNPNFYRMEKEYGANPLESDKFTQDEKNAIHHYGFTGYKDYNPIMRGQSNYKPESFMKDIELIKNAPKQKLKENTYLYRGGRMDAKLEVGDVVRDKAFVSTSFAKSVASDFARFQGDGKNKYLFQIAAKKGTEGIYLGHDEVEWLLNADSSFKVTSLSEKDEHGVVTVGVNYGQ